MAQTADCNPPVPPNPESGPGLHLVETTSPEGAFFDPETGKLITLDQIDFKPIQRTGMETEQLDARYTVRYLMGITRGEIDGTQFDDFYDQAVGLLLEPKASDRLMSIYDTLIEMNHNIMPLLAQLRPKDDEDTSILPNSEYVTTNKLCLFVTALYESLPNEQV